MDVVDLGSGRSGQVAGRSSLNVQVIGFGSDALGDLARMLHGAGEQLGVGLRLTERGGDVVVMAADVASSLAPEVLAAFRADRPLVELDAGAALGRVAGRVRAALELAARLRILVRERQEVTSDPPADSQFDSRIDGDRPLVADLDSDGCQLLAQLRAGLVDPGVAPLLACYGDDAVMKLDFATATAWLDERALRRLRAAGELPMLARAGGPRDNAVARELDLVVWDLGLACGGYGLLDAPRDWWRSALAAPPAASVARYTRKPSHLELARLLRAGPACPQALRRAGRVGVGELLPFVQACLLLGLVYWRREG